LRRKSPAMISSSRSLKGSSMMMPGMIYLISIDRLTTRLTLQICQGLDLRRGGRREVDLESHSGRRWVPMQKSIFGSLRFVSTLFSPHLIFPVLFLGFSFSILFLFYDRYANQNFIEIDRPTLSVYRNVSEKIR